MRMNQAGFLRLFAKKVTPTLGQAIHSLGLVGVTQGFANYANLLAGQGAGSGWDKGEETVAARIIRARGANPVVIDCGANRGEWIAEVRHQLGSDQGTWIAVEPNPGCAPLLGKLPHLELVPVAAGEAPGKLDLYSTDFTPEMGYSTGLGSLYPRRDTIAQGHQFQTRPVEVRTIDSILEERGIRRVDFLKMDLEGHELFALRGATAALSAGVIRALSFEFGAGNVNSRTFFRDFWELLSPYGYAFHRICPGGVTVPVTEYYEDLEFFRGVSNYLAKLPESMPTSLPAATPSVSAKLTSAGSK